MLRHYASSSVHALRKLRLAPALLLVLFTAIALIGAAAPASAETEPVRRSLSLEQSKGRMIRFDVAVKTVFIANPDIADVQVKSPMVLYVTAKKPGETTLIAVDDSDHVLANIGITVNHNLSRLKRTLDAVMPGNRIQVRSVDGAVLLVGEVENPVESEQAVEIAMRFVEKKEEIINNIAVKGPNMVNLRVRVVEMQRGVTRQIGINWENVYQAGAVSLGLFTGAAPFVLQAGNAVLNTRRQLGNNTVNNFVARYARGNYDATALVDLLEQDGLVKTLAQPNLSTMSGKPAHFLAGGEFPIPVAQRDGVITIEFKRFGVSLTFTPVILSGKRITMRVAPEVSQLSNNGAIRIQNGLQIPALTTRRADTMIEVASGQSFAIGGLLQNDVIRDINKVPWLSDIPILGKLFTSENFQRNETELVIIVTPYIVGPIRELPREPVAPVPGPNAAAPKGAVGATPTGAALPPAANSTRVVGPGQFQLD